MRPEGIKRAAYHPICHLEIHEQRGLHELHGIEPVLLGGKDRLIDLGDVQKLDDTIACLLLELPQREIGGQLPDYGELEAISAYCRERGLPCTLTERDCLRFCRITGNRRRRSARCSTACMSLSIKALAGLPERFSRAIPNSRNSPKCGKDVTAGT